MKCFYVPNSTTIIDTINPITGLSSVDGETLEEIQRRRPGVEVVDFDEACEQVRAASYAKYKSAPEEVDLERWDEALNCMPPMKWRGELSTESFMICEAMTADLHSIYCRIGDRYFRLCDSRNLTHGEIVSLCRGLLDEPEAPQVEEACPSCGEKTLFMPTGCLSCGHLTGL